ncbi:hypothetical protein SGFS_042930 [Streptomyces graminofaciens]|uniref:AMP-dependent synthetase/ligase domain-containing protein n=1 Tax=Streptomyces graminofaciens TaxID=68212 RepID=A0ABM9SBU6_9ACTN|nr:AMP-binding protein [Streptomyces graminofaciens]BBC32999.1 hypothetical protein SGFS_042930 [Streptomyces graminofaciens]
MEQEAATRQRDRASSQIARYLSRPDATLTGILDVRARCTPHHPAFRVLPDGTSNHIESWTYGDLKRNSDAVAARLRSAGHSGDRVVLAGQPGLRFVAGLMGILQVGATAVPAFPPTNRRAVTRLRSILADCAPGAILAEPRHERRFTGMAAGGDVLPGLIPLDLDDELPSKAADDPVRPTDTALIQYSSGSTGDPKGVELTHANLMSNCHAIGRHIGAEDDRVGLTWLPPYHDMGLIGTIMLALHGGWPLLMMTPEHFVQQPARWLQAITEHRVTITVAPNFAFQLCADTVDDDDLAGVDLSSLRHVFCGSEPVVLDTLDAFRKRYEPPGLPRADPDLVLGTRRGHAVRDGQGARDGRTRRVGGPAGTVARPGGGRGGRYKRLGAPCRLRGRGGGPRTAGRRSGLRPGAAGRRGRRDLGTRPQRRRRLPPQTRADRYDIRRDARRPRRSPVRTRICGPATSAICALANCSSPAGSAPCSW